ncbi:MAG: hypothetical protein B5M52_06345 [Helicobacteraceae bacterium 4484_230]|nr:MAG: hypothetical protein B5M52_06345 [Helicobacteraceae bacterium 4484_230]
MKLSKGSVWILGIVAVLIILGVMAMSYHNKAVSMDEKVSASWSQVLNQYKRRSDLIPNLVGTVKGYASHEKDVLTQVTEARAKVGQMQLSPQMLNDPASFAAFEKNQGALTSALSRLMLVVERYPDLKANQNFLSLQSQLEGTENRISVARRDYIEVVRVFNTMLRRFPAKFFLSVTDGELEPKPTFSIGEAETKTPEVAF